MESHYLKPKIYSPNPEAQRIWDEFAQKNRESKASNVIAELCEQVSKERGELITKTIERLPTKYDKIIRGTTVNVGVETKTSYFGYDNILRDNFWFEGEYLFTTVEWTETELSNSGGNSKMHFKIVYEPQENIVFSKI